MNSKQMDVLQAAHGIAPGQEWSVDGGFSPEEQRAAAGVLAASPFFRLKESYPNKVSPDGKRDYSHLADTYDIPGASLFRSVLVCAYFLYVRMSARILFD